MLWRTTKGTAAVSSAGRTSGGPDGPTGIPARSRRLPEPKVHCTYTSTATALNF
jgi:hypothetical protein